jgi:hypothetical protein
MSQAAIYQCPHCKEYIASDATYCRFCKAPMDPNVRAQAVEKLAQDNKRERRRDATKHMLIGAGLFVLGVAITAGTYTMASEGGSYVITYGLVISGAADFIYGGYMWLSG